MPRRLKHCSRCGGGLASTEVEEGVANALFIRFSGGYGQFIDPLDAMGGEYVAVLCHECAHLFCDLNSWVKNLFDPETSHIHSEPRPEEEHVSKAAIEKVIRGIEL